MPIGTVDYVSTAPWNSVLNPWPQYSRISLSAVDSDLGEGAMFVYDLVAFNPMPGQDQASWQYTCTTELDGTFSSVLLKRDNNPNNYYAEVSYDGDVLYQLDDVTSRNIPQGGVQGNALWTEINGSNASTLSIVPVTTYLTPWEHRRRRTLEYV